jgi:hypothetical protein
MSFCVSWIYGTNIYHGMPFYFLCHVIFEVMNSHACACVINNYRRYDYNINNRFEKGDT